MGHSNRLISQLNSDPLEKLSQVSTDSKVHGTPESTTETACFADLPLLGDIIWGKAMVLLKLA